MRILVCTIAVLILAGAGVITYQQQRVREAQATLATLQPGPIDTGFAQSMSLHHYQAIGMAQLMLDGRPTGLGALARAISTAQLVELGEMRGWLRLWNKPVMTAKPVMDWMLLGSVPPDAELSSYLLDCRRSPTGMTGLATDAEMNRLRTLEGRDRDRHFLTLMLAHHQGGVPMARFAMEQAQLPTVRELAGRVVLDQSREIVHIQQMLGVLASMGQ
ncbi:MAG TPA: DUF305 domain-containing protein [Solimonas sp.]|nr:DUF305 domain-containing protein [Solimonas sp.]